MLLYFVIVPVVVGLVEASIQYATNPSGEPVRAILFALSFTVPGMFFAWLTTSLLARFGAARHLSAVALLVLGYVAALILFRPYYLFVYDLGMTTSPHMRDAILARQYELDASSIATFFIVNLPGVIIWTAVNVVSMNRFGFPRYQDVRSSEPASSGGHHHNPITPTYPSRFGLREHDHLWSISAEEHYLRLRGDFGERVIRHSLKQALTAIDDEAGLRVHRSHWVAFGAVRELQTEGSMQLELPDATIIPVSKSYQQAVLLTKAALLRV